MNGVYVAIVIAVAIVIVVWLLRQRLTSLRGKADVTKRSGEFEIKAAQPQARDTGAQPSAYSVDVSDNRVLGVGQFRIFRDSVRAARNWILGKGAVTVGRDEDQRRK
jgi:hypothetical protein